MNRNTDNTENNKSVLSVIGMKVLAVPALVGTMILTLAGCGNAIPDMSTDVEQKVGEYAGVVMLRYDANHRSRLVDLPEEEMVEEPVIEEPEPEPEPEPPAEEEVPAVDESTVTVIDNSTEEEPENITPEEFLNLPQGVSLIYQGYSIESSYPANSVDSYFTLDASSGKKLIVLYYNLYNQSGSDCDINFLGDGYAFKVVINGKTTRTALVTMLMDDMSTYIGTVANGNGEELVLIFEEDENVEITSLELNIKGNEGKCSVTLE